MLFHLSSSLFFLAKIINLFINGDFLSLNLLYSQFLIFFVGNNNKGLLSVRFNIINIFINNKPNIKYKTYICAIIV